MVNRVPYAALIHCFTKIEATTKRLEILTYLTEFLVLVVDRAAPAVEGSTLVTGDNALEVGVFLSCFN